VADFCVVFGVVAFVCMPHVTVPAYSSHLRSRCFVAVPTSKCSFLQKFHTSFLKHLQKCKDSYRNDTGIAWHFNSIRNMVEHGISWNIQFAVKYLILQHIIKYHTLVGNTDQMLTSQKTKRKNTSLGQSADHLCRCNTFADQTTTIIMCTWTTPEL